MKDKKTIIIISIAVLLVLIFFLVIFPILTKKEPEKIPDCKKYGNDWEAVKVNKEDIKNDKTLVEGDYYCCIGTSRIKTGRCQKVEE